MELSVQNLSFIAIIHADEIYGLHVLQNNSVECTKSVTSLWKGITLDGEEG